MLSSVTRHADLIRIPVYGVCGGRLPGDRHVKRGLLSRHGRILIEKRIGGFIGRQIIQ